MKLKKPYFGTFWKRGTHSIWAVTHVTGFIYGPETQGRYLGEPVPMGPQPGVPCSLETASKRVSVYMEWV